jgi:Patatin-like phospholipase
MSALYRKRGKQIFDDSIWDNIKDLGHAIGADYGHKGIKKALREQFGDATLADLRKHVLVPSFDLDAPADGDRPRRWKPKFFHNFDNPDSEREESVVDVAIRTSSAPTYFPSYQGYVDGGVVANNPSMAALAQALSRTGGDAELEDVVLLSLGTGTEPKFIQGDRNWGWGEWARPLVSLIIDGLMGVADYECKQVLGAGYHRVTAYFDRAVNMDDPRDSNLDYLEARAAAVDLAPTLEWLEQVHW